MSMTKPSLIWYIALMSIMAIAGSIYYLINDYFSWLLALPLIGLVIASETLRIKLYMYKTNESISVSWTMVISLVALLSLGPAESILINAISGVICSFYPNRSNLLKLFYNISSPVLTVVIVCLVTDFLSTQISFDQEAIIFALGLSLFYVVVNYSLAGILMRILVKKSLKNFLANIIIPYSPHTFIFLLAGTIFGVSYRNYGFNTIPMMLFIISLTLYTMRLTANGAIQQIKDLEKSHQQAEQLADQVKNDMNNFIKTLTAAIDARDSYMYGHSIQVSNYATDIAMEMGLPEEEVHKIRIAGLLHDIGKISLPESILFKEGRLTNEEYELIKQHTIIGEDIIKPVDGLHEIAELIGRHHERYDGNGYPYKLKGNEIPIGACIIAVADTLDTILSDRSYKKGKTLEEALAEFRRCQGTQFHPDVVNALIHLCERKGVGIFQNSASLIDSQVIQSFIRVKQAKLLS